MHRRHEPFCHCGPSSKCRRTWAVPLGRSMWMVRGGVCWLVVLSVYSCHVAMGPQVGRLFNASAVFSNPCFSAPL